MPPEETLSQPADAPTHVRRLNCSPSIADTGPGAERHVHVIDTNPWHKNNITYRISSAPDGLKECDVQSAIHTAFCWWHEAIPTLTFEPIEDPNQVVDIEIGFFKDEIHDPNDGYPFRPPVKGEAQIVAHTFPPIPASKSLGGDIHFNKYAPWNVQTSSDFDLSKYFDLITIAAHEIGHALGLDHLEDPDSLMHENFVNLQCKVDESSQQALLELHAGVKKVAVCYDVTPSPLEGGGGSNPWRAYGKRPDRADVPPVS